MRRFQYGMIAALALAIAVACHSRRAAKSAEVPAEILSVTKSALEASSTVRITGEIAPALRRPDASLYADAMQQHFAMMVKLHDSARNAGITYPRYALAVRPQRFCANATTARLHLAALVRYDMTAPAGAPPYTSGMEEHVFRLVRHGDHWRVAEHHEITLAELHDAEAMERLRDCDPERVIVDDGVHRKDRDIRR